MRFPSPPPFGQPPAPDGLPVADGPPVPDGLPLPRPYGHLAPDDGACLMETASVLAAEPFTDAPRGTDPALAALARAVNDAVGDRARHRLLPLAADLAAARPAARSFTPALIADVLRAARALRPSSRLLALRQDRCRRRARRLAGGTYGAYGPLAGARDALWWRGPGRHHLEHALRVLVRAPDADDRLPALLRDAVTAATTEATADATGGTPSAHTGRAADSPSVTVG